MLTITGTASSACDGVSRRGFLKIGALGLAGLTLPELLRARAAARTFTQTAAILIWCNGGPSHFETHDPKPGAPAEYRGPAFEMVTGRATREALDLSKYAGPNAAEFHRFETRTCLGTCSARRILTRVRWEEKHRCPRQPSEKRPTDWLSNFLTTPRGRTCCTKSTSVRRSRRAWGTVEPGAWYRSMRSSGGWGCRHERLLEPDGSRPVAGDP